MIDYALALDGMPSFTREELRAEGYRVAWRGPVAWEDWAEEPSRPVVVERNGWHRPGYVAGSAWVVFEEVKLIGLPEAQAEAERAHEACCGSSLGDRV